MPYPVDSMMAELGSDRNNRSAADVKKTRSASKHVGGEQFLNSASEPAPAKCLRKTGIPRVKPKPVDKKPATEDKHLAEDRGKRTGSVILEKQVVNKKAQRAKGSTAIGRIPAPVPKSRPVSSVDQMSRPATKERETSDVEKTASGKLKPLRKGSRAKMRPIRTDSKESDPHFKRPWIPDKMEDKRRPHKDGETQMSASVADNPKNREIAQNSMPSLPASTCSFFEKIQQGVRAYFTSKTSNPIRSATPEESIQQSKTNLTEGGIELMKEVGQENPEKRRAVGVFRGGKVSRIKLTGNYKSYGDRSRAPAGGVSRYLTLFDAKRRVYRQFRMMKRKKLYHPKKHYVRIQIPRKGYFYRSHVYPEVPATPSFLPARLESDFVQKTQPEIQISRLAASSIKSSHIFQAGLTEPKLRKKTKGWSDGNETNGCDRLRNTSNRRKIESDIESISVAFPHLKSKDNTPRLSRIHAKTFHCLEYDNNGIISLQFDGDTDNENCLDSPEDTCVDKCLSPAKETEMERNATVKRWIFVESEDLQTDGEIMESSEYSRAENQMAEESSTGIGDNSRITDFTWNFENPIENYQFWSEFTAGDLLLSSKRDNIMDIDEGAIIEPGSPVWKPISQPMNVPELEDIHVPVYEYSRSQSSSSRSNVDSTDCLSNQFSLYPGYENFRENFMADIDLHLELENYLKAIYGEEADVERVRQGKTDERVEEYFKKHGGLEEPNETETAGENFNKSLQFSPIQNDLNEFKDFFSPNRHLSDKSNDTISVSSATQLCAQVRKPTAKWVKSENDLLGERIITGEFDSYIRRTAGKTSFQLTASKNEIKLLNANNIKKSPFRIDDLLSKTTDSQSSTYSMDDYFKLYVTDFEFSTDSIFPLVRVKSRVKPKIINFSGPILSNIPDKTVSVEKCYKKNVEKRSSVEELLKMYNSVLRERKKNLKVQKKPFNEKATEALLSFIDILLQAKKNKEEMIKLPRITDPNAPRPPSNAGRYYYGYRKPGRTQSQEYLTLQEYVNMVQKMLSSALSIQQITTLNEITAKFQKTYSPGKISPNKIKRIKRPVKVVTNRKIKEFKEAEASSNCRRKIPAHAAPKTSARIPVRVRTEKKTMKAPAAKSAPRILKTAKDESPANHSAGTEEIPVKIKNLEISSPEVLKSILVSQFQVPKEGPPPHRKGKKLLVRVKLSGEKILVSAVNQIQNENFETRKVDESDETSDLIIENVQGDQLDRIMCDRTNESEKDRSNPRSVPRSHQKEPDSAGTNEPKPATATTKIQYNEIPPVRKGGRHKMFKMEEIVNNKKDVVPIGDFYTRQKLFKYLKSPYKSGEKLNLINPYEYDQQKLKAQHPIEAIMESSECKLDDFSSEETEDREELAGVRHEEKPAGTESPEPPHKYDINVVPSKPVKSGNARKLNRTQSYALGVDSRATETLLRRDRTRAKKCAKSLEDTSFSRKSTRKLIKWSRKKVQARSCNIFCYPLTEHGSNEKKLKSKKTSNDSREARGTASKTKRKPSVETTLRVDNLAGKSAAQVDNKLDEEKTSANDKIEKNAVNRAKWPKPQRFSDFDNRSVEFLYNDCNRASNMSQDSSEFEEQSVRSGKIENRIPCDSTSAGSGKLDSRDLPVFIHPPKADPLEISFPSLLIRSDSFLKSRSGFLLTKSKIKSIFKSNSDMKFFPGKLLETEDGEKQAQQPFVTFVLTPKQRAVAGIPSGQIKVVLPDLHSRPQKDELDNDGKQDEDEDEDENDLLGIKKETEKIEQERKELRSIEKFINSLSKCMLRRNSKISKEKRKNKAAAKSERKAHSFNSNLAEPKKKDVPCQRFMAFYMFHENVPDHQKKRKSTITDGMTKGKSVPHVTEGPKPQITAKKSAIEQCKATIQAPEPKNPKILVEENEEIAGDKKDELLKEEKSQMTFRETMKDQCSSTSELLKLVDELVKSPSCVETRDLSPTAEEKAQPEERNAAKLSAANTTIFNGKTEYMAKNSEAEKSMIATSTDEQCNKKLKTYKIRISCAAKKSHSAEVNATVKRKKPKRNSSLQRPRAGTARDPSPEMTTGIHVRDKSISRNIPLKREPSEYFDAEEIDIKSGENHEIVSAAEPEKKITNGRPAEGNADFSTLTANFPASAPKNSPADDVDRKIFDNLVKNLQKEDFAQVMTLLEDFLEKSGGKKLQKQTGNSSQMPNVLKSIENKSENLMESMEKNGWLKILGRLDKIDQYFTARLNGESFSDDALNDNNPGTTGKSTYLEKHVSDAGKLLKAIQVLIDKTLITEEASSKAPEPNQSFFECQIDRKDMTVKIFARIGDCIKYLKNIVTASKPESEHVIPWAQKDGETETDELLMELIKPTDEKRLLQSLRKQIRHKRIRIQYLANVERGQAFPQVFQVRLKVVNKLLSLEKTISSLESKLNGHPSKSSDSLLNFKLEPRKFSFFKLRENVFGLTRKSSLLNLTSGCKNFLFGTSSENLASPETETLETC